MKGNQLFSFFVSYIPVTVMTAEDPAAPTDLRMSIFLPLLKDERVDANLHFIHG
jgi:hypothetical protein